MTSQRVQGFYTRRANLYQHFFVRFLQWETVLETFFATHASLQPGMKILDAGCGSGPVTRVLYHLARQQGLADLTFHGFDLTPAMLDLFRQWMEDEGVLNIQLRQADVLELDQQLPEDWKSYDLIVSAAMLEYIPQAKRQQVLTHLRELLGENGRLLLFLTKKTWITRWIGTKWWGTRLFTRTELESLLQQAGFTTIAFHPLPEGWNAFLLASEAQVGS